MFAETSTSAAFARNLNNLMHHARMTNKEMAQLLGVTPQYVSCLRHIPHSRIAFSHIDRICACFQIDPNTLLT